VPRSRLSSPPAAALIRLRPLEALVLRVQALRVQALRVRALRVRVLRVRRVQGLLVAVLG